MAVEEFSDVRVADWGARVDPYVIVSVGSVTKKTQIFKRAQDAKVNEKFEFPLPADHALRGWELWIRVIDAQTSLALGQVTLDLNEVFSEDEEGSNREPLKLEYTSIALPLESVRYGEDVSGSVTITLSSTVALPKAILVRESRAGLIDLDMPEALTNKIFTDKQKAYMLRSKGLVRELEDAMPKLIASVGGAAVWQMMLGEAYSPPSIGAAGFVYAPTVMGSPASPSSSSSSGVPKVKSFLKSLGQGGSGSGSGLLAGLTGGKKSSSSAAGEEGIAAELPAEILMRIVSYLPPWSALSVRRVNRLWDVVAQPQLPELWALLHAFQKSRTAKSDTRDEARRDFCIKALPFMKECIKVVQFQTSTRFLGSPMFPPLPWVGNINTNPLINGVTPTNNAPTGSAGSAISSATSSSPAVASSSSSSSSSATATGSAIGIPGMASDTIFVDPGSRGCPLGSYQSVADLAKCLSLLELWRQAVISALSSQRAHLAAGVWDDAITFFRNAWETTLPADMVDPIDALSFQDPEFWKALSTLFSVGDTDNTFLKILSRLVGNVEQAEVMSCTNRIKDQLENKSYCIPEQVPRLCEIFINLSLILKLTLDEPKAGKISKKFAFLKDYEAVIPPECTRFLISQGLMKDHTYTKFW